MFFLSRGVNDGVEANDEQNKALDNVKSGAGSKATSAAPSSRASSASPAPASKSKSKKGKK
jgi:SWI/SNF-related matrix-associated actin-dependent regulator of chromatin subfamily A member 5